MWRRIHSTWRTAHMLPRRVRWPGKLLAFGFLTLLVLFPKLWLIPTTIQRVSNLEALLDPAHPDLAPLETEVVAQLAGRFDSVAVLPVVQEVVNQRIRYEWDWDNYGVMEFLPTTAEALARGREDCDGRAIVAASLLRRLGYEAWLVSDLLHMWVETPEGETMSPSVGAKTVVAGRTGQEDEGTETTLSLGMLLNLARGTAFGISVFPLPREIILLLGICVLAVHPRSSIRRRFFGCVLLAAALALLRYGGRDAAISQQVAATMVVACGAALALVGWLTLVIKDRDSRPRSVPALAE